MKEIVDRSQVAFVDELKVGRVIACVRQITPPAIPYVLAEYTGDEQSCWAFIQVGSNCHTRDGWNHERETVINSAINSLGTKVFEFLDEKELLSWLKERLNEMFKEQGHGSC